ncbi:MAG: arginine--tRNA ligase [Candidatus Nanoarchaeia archaeon]|nr:arginine--tRNA ligase [Candidatus Nanoarchaeia archaeon]MDD5357712.1 arginine--tRNA ligase [Candidatus Nanoarchaeia archaeon]MDD5588631.1 arginine--tRNA ligase [Candidatus Nanoarchaeia archaeon]
MKEIIIQILKKSGITLKDSEIEKLIEVPPSSDFGDYSFPCFILSKKEKKSPDKIAEHLTEKIKLPGEIEKVESKGPYLNFFVNKKILAEQIIKINSNFGKSPIGKNKKIVIDFSAPNIGKPMHIGHIRSTILGDSLMRIYSFLGYDSIGVNYLGDIGLHIGKLIVAYELWLDKDALKKNPVQELLRLYVKFCAKEKSKLTEGVEEEFQDNEWTNRAKEKLKLLELGDKNTEKIWHDIRKSSEKGFNKVYEMLNVDFNETVGQSEFSEHGKKIVTNALLKNIARSEKDGAVYVEIDRQKKFILRSNQTASYITYDIGAAVERYKKYNFEKMIYVTDFRQKDHFDKLFKILKLFGYDFSDKLVHLPFGTIRFGKEIIATRTGDIILLEDVLKKTIEKAEKEIRKRKTKGDAEKVGVGAVKYVVLKSSPSADVQFSWEQALNFEGDSGPYIQYSYARASSIIKKAGKFNKSKIKILNLTPAENNLVKKISMFPEIVINSEQSLNPGLIANYSFELAQIFNEFYHTCPVIGDKSEAFRLLLVDAFRTTIKNSLYLLGIEVAEEM